ncbi:hypothetical protein GCM10009841_05450 [Microlunatus panaciterrae]
MPLATPIPPSIWLPTSVRTVRRWTISTATVALGSVPVSVTVQVCRPGPGSAASPVGFAPPVSFPSRVRAGLSVSQVDLGNCHEARAISLAK